MRVAYHSKASLNGTGRRLRGNSSPQHAYSPPLDYMAASALPSSNPEAAPHKPHRAGSEIEGGYRLRTGTFVVVIVVVIVIV
jgi:hypothetical protein